MLTLLKILSPVLVMISCMFVPIYSHFHAGQANSGKITFFSSGCSSFSPLLRGVPIHSDMKFCHEILETLGYHMVKTQSLSHQLLDWYWVVTDGQTELP